MIFAVRRLQNCLATIKAAVGTSHDRHTFIVCSLTFSKLTLIPIQFPQQWLSYYCTATCIHHKGGSTYSKTWRKSWCYFATIVYIPYDLCISESHVPLNGQVHPGCQHEKLYEFVESALRLSWGLKINVRILQQKPTCRVTSPQRYGCHTASTYIRRSCCSPTKRTFFPKIVIIRHFTDKATVCMCIRNLFGIW